MRTVNAFGIKISVSIEQGPNTSNALAESILERLTSAWKDSPEPVEPAEPAEQPIVELGKVTEANYEQIHSLMSSKVTLAALEAHAGSYLMLHAGGIARADGSVAVIIGPSGRGKTTTMRQLGQSYGYVSDETIAITDSGEILPYRKPLSIVAEGHPHKLQIAPSDLGLLPLPDERLFLGGIALLERAKSGESKSKISNIGFARGVATAIEQSSYLIDLEQPLSTVCALAASVGGFKELVVGHPSRIHEVAEQLFISESAPSWERMMPIIQDATESTAAYLPGDIVEAVECEDGTVIFTESRQVFVLEGIGPQLWRAVCFAESWENLIGRIEYYYGSAPSGDTKAAIQSIAMDLVETGVLRLPASAGGKLING